MHSPEALQNNPDIVFEPEYWGPINEDLSLAKMGQLPGASLRQYMRISKETGPVVSSVLRNQTNGMSIAHGVTFNPMNHELARLSPVNYPGSLLLMDIEFLGPNLIMPEDIGSREDVSLSPRALIRSTAEEVRGDEIMVRGHVLFSNEQETYIRMALFVYNGLTRMRRPVPLALRCHAENISAEGEPVLRTFFVKARAAAVGLGQAVRESYSHHWQDPSIPQAISRIRSIELCAAGEPAKAPSAVRELLGNFALGQPD